MSVVEQRPGGSVAGRPNGVAVVGVTVVDTMGGPSRSGCTVLVSGDRIREVGPAEEVGVPDDVAVVDGRGRFLMPGLWDMHVHVFDPGSLDLFLGNGVTGVRHMAGAPIHHEWRRALDDSAMVAPRMVLASAVVDGPQPLRPHSIPVATPDDAARALESILEVGADFVKVYNLVPRAAYESLVAAAAREGMPVAGHVPYAVGLDGAVQAGQASVEHLEGVLVATSTDAHGLRARLADVDGPTFEIMGQVAAIEREAAETHDPARLVQVCHDLVARSIWQVPTLAVHEAAATVGTPEFSLQPHLGDIPGNLRTIWDQAAQGAHPDQQPHAKRLLQRQIAVVGAMHRQGVALMAGTDTFVPGASLHDELELLVSAGLAPLAALQTATINPARFLGVDDDLGSVAPGNLADLVLLDADPQLDITHTRRIHAVIIGGRHLDCDALDDLRTPTPP